MKIITKIIVGLLLLVAVAAISGYLYFVRNQKIDVGFIPSEFKYCGKIITGADPEYKEISSWLRANSNGWSRDWNTQIGGLVYYYPPFSVVVFNGGVSVSYKTEYGFSRFVKSVNHSLNTACAKYS